MVLFLGLDRIGKAIFQDIPGFAALSLLLERKEAEIALRLAAALWWFWLTLGHWSEGCQWFEKVLSRGEEVTLPMRRELADEVEVLCLVA